MNPELSCVATYAMNASRMSLQPSTRVFWHFCDVQFSTQQAAGRESLIITNVPSATLPASLVIVFSFSTVNSVV